MVCHHFEVDDLNNFCQVWTAIIVHYQVKRHAITCKEHYFPIKLNFSLYIGSARCRANNLSLSTLAIHRVVWGWIWPLFDASLENK